MYSFARYNDETMTPFYISDVGVNEGITGSKYFILKFDLNYSTGEDSSMNGKFMVNNKTI